MHFVSEPPVFGKPMPFNLKTECPKGSKGCGDAPVYAILPGILGPLTLNAWGVVSLSKAGMHGRPMNSGRPQGDPIH